MDSGTSTHVVEPLAGNCNYLFLFMARMKLDSYQLTHAQASKETVNLVKKLNISINLVCSDSAQVT